MQSRISHRSRKMRTTYTVDSIMRAVTMIRNKEVTLSAASRQFMIPKSTLSDHVRGEGKSYSIGPGRALSQEMEQAVVEVLLYMNARHFPVTGKVLAGLVLRMLREAGDKVIKKAKINMNQGPSFRWRRHFARRHPLVLWENESNSVPHVTNISKFFSLYEQELQKLDQPVNPEDIFVCTQCLVRDDITNRYVTETYIEGKQKVCFEDCVVSVTCSSLSGHVLPSMLVYKRPHVNAQAYTPPTHMPEDWLYGETETGFMDISMFRKWFYKCFYTHHRGVNSEDRESLRPRILLLDNSQSLVTLDVIDYAVMNKILIIGLPALAIQDIRQRAMLQKRPSPCNDYSIFCPIEHHYKALVGGRVLDRDTCLQLWIKAVSEVGAQQLCETFREVGLYPCDPTRLDRIITDRKARYNAALAAIRPQLVHAAVIKSDDNSAEEEPSLGTRPTPSQNRKTSIRRRKSQSKTIHNPQSEKKRRCVTNSKAEAGPQTPPTTVHTSQKKIRSDRIRRHTGECERNEEIVHGDCKCADGHLLKHEPPDSGIVIESVSGSNNVAVETVNRKDRDNMETYVIIESVKCPDVENVVVFEGLLHPQKDVECDKSTTGSDQISKAAVKHETSDMFDCSSGIKTSSTNNSQASDITMHSIKNNQSCESSNHTSVTNSNTKVFVEIFTGKGDIITNQESKTPRETSDSENDNTSEQRIKINQDKAHVAHMAGDEVTQSSHDVAQSSKDVAHAQTSNEVPETNKTLPFTLVTFYKCDLCGIYCQSLNKFKNHYNKSHSTT